jgi:Holliday junction resolvase RusA-like endonuclease
LIHAFTIAGRLPGYNDLKASTAYWWKAANAKKRGMQLVGWAILEAGLPKFEKPVIVKIKCIERDGRRDRDNVSSGAGKVILDALQQQGVIENDNRKCVRDIQYDTTQIDKENPRVEVTLEEVA